MLHAPLLILFHLIALTKSGEQRAKYVNCEASTQLGIYSNTSG